MPSARNAFPRSRYVVFFTIALVGLALDLASKSWMFANLGMPNDQAPWWLWDNIFGFQTALNEGALFGMGQGKGVIFIALSLVAVVGVVYWLFVAGGAIELWLTVALGGVMAGTLGNLYDRMGLPGLVWADQGRAGEPVYAVRDFILFQCAWFDWPNFNIADSFLVCGACMLAWHACFHQEPVVSAAAQQPSA